MWLKQVEACRSKYMLCGLTASHVHAVGAQAHEQGGDRQDWCVERQGRDSSLVRRLAVEA